jgi:arabinan endo-1,5-alpha-L-arabinosidase
MFGSGGAPITIPDVADVSKTWPTGDIGLRLGEYMIGAHQKWAISPVGGDFKIVVAGTSRALSATTDRDVVTVQEFSNKPEQLWTISLLSDGTFKIAPKGAQGDLVLTAVGVSTPTLAKFDPNSDKSKWNIRTP